MMKFRSIQAKILFTTCLLIAVFFGIQKFYISPLLQRHDISEMEFNQEAVADHLALSIDLNFQAYTTSLEILAHTPSLESMQKEAIDQSLSQGNELSRFFDYFFVTDTEGRWVSYPSRPHLVGQVVKNDYWVGEALAEDRTSFLDIHYATSIKSLVAGFASPIRNSRNENVGILRGVITIPNTQHSNALFAMIRNFKFGNDGTIFIVDSKGRPLAHPDFSLDADSFGDTDLSSLPPVEMALAGRSGTTEYTFNNRKYSASYRPVKTTGWGLVVQQPIAGIASYVSEEAASITSINLVFIVVSFLILLLIFIKSISPLTTLLESLQNNNFKTGSEYPRDEIGLLAGEIQALFAKLNSAKEELGKALTDQGKRIAERTLELSESNEKLINEIQEKEKVERSLRESEERYRSLFENASDIIQTVNPDGRLLYVNPSWCKAMGYTEEEAVRLKIFDLIYPENADKCGLHFRTTLAEGSSGTMETVFQSKDGRKVVLHGSANCKYSNGQPSFVHCIFQNVTERRRMEEELSRMHKLESIGILAGGIAHDFNNILTSILGNLTLARIQSGPDEKISKRIEEAEQATLRARDLTQQLLTFSKGGEPVRVTTSLREIIKDSCRFVLRGSNVKCKFDLSEDLLLVDSDQGQISQVLHNLAVNADQAMPDGGLLNIKAENVRISGADDLPLRSGDYVLIKVEDSGSGISENNLKKIFDPYFSTKEEGHGLGLATSYSIIKKHGGLLTAESEPGVGSVFKIYLPASTKTALSRSSAKEKIYPGNGFVLLMDDEEHVRETGRELLEHLGYRVETAADGRQVLEMYREAVKVNAPYDVIILDLTVPGGMGGKETLDRLLELDPGLKVIVSSGYANNPIMANYEEHGFSGVMPKPYKIEKVSKMLFDLI
ncbi:MAG: PAS domain S-box protein, partial [Desulfurivibrionaceae bacterium]